MNNEDVIKSALKKVESQQEKEIFNVDEHWEVRGALEKRISKKPIKTVRKVVAFGNYYYYECPCCGNAFLKKWVNERQQSGFCWMCGQKLDWKGV